MRRFALIFAGFVAVVIAALNYVDTKFPGGLGSLDFSGAAAEAPQTPAEPQPAPPSQAPAAKHGPAAATSFSEPEIQPMWPGSKVARIVYGARPYVDMTVVSISPQTVVLRNDREIVSIPTGSLPADLRAMATAYLTGADGPPYARLGSPAFPATPAPAEPAPTTVLEVAPQEETDAATANESAIAWQAARERAEWWLRYERERRLTDIVPLVTGVDMGNPYPLSGLKGYWRVRGRGYVATSQETKGGTFHDFEVTVILDSGGNILRADFKLL
ncbi:MAG TPA: hypothetical protein VMM36_05805 [Opitutaceae bacterium]|nr:hypothetical protein [Opitutaceae bacterium]